MNVRLTLLALGLCALAEVNALSIRGPLEKRSPYEKRNPLEKAALEKRLIIRNLKRDTLPAQYQYVGSVQQPAQQVPLYYYLKADGTYGSAPAATFQQPQQAPAQVYQEVPYVAPQQSSGGLLSFLSKPISGLSKVVGFTGDVVQGIVDVPFSFAKDLVGVVGLDNSIVGKAATGILDTANTIVKAPVELVKNVGQLPLDLVANVVQAIDEE